MYMKLKAHQIRLKIAIENYTKSCKCFKIDKKLKIQQYFGLQKGFCYLISTELIK